MARSEEIKVLLLLHDGLAHDPAELASWTQEARCIPGFFFRSIYLGNNPQEKAAMNGLLGADRLIDLLARRAAPEVPQRAAGFPAGGSVVWR